MNGNPALVGELRRNIAARGGRVTFAEFMEQALYHPQFGYYMAGRERIGKRADYFTSVSVGPLFGRILARQFQMWGVRDVYEFGGQRGQLRDDILAALPGLNYHIIEAGEPLPERMTGCVFSNEFLDALPVHRVCGSQEVYVTAEFAEELGPLSDARLIRLPDGYRSEFNLRALDWLTEVARRLDHGYILTVDYGFERPEYFAPHHAAGHLQCYFKHTKNSNPYQNIGEQDITAHVEFTSFIEHGKTLGLEPVLFADQAHYLLQVGEPVIREIVERTAGQLSAERQAIHQLTHPGLMGRAFKVLIQRQSHA